MKTAIIVSRIESGVPVQTMLLVRYITGAVASNSSDCNTIIGYKVGTEPPVSCHVLETVAEIAEFINS
jgi:hypothetical protein